MERATYEKCENARNANESKSCPDFVAMTTDIECNIVHNSSPSLSNPALVVNIPYLC